MNECNHLPYLSPASFTGCVKPHPRSCDIAQDPLPTMLPSLGGTNALIRTSSIPTTRRHDGNAHS